MSELTQLDLKLFHDINQVWTHPLLDVFLAFMRNMYVWAPLYVFMIAYLVLNFGKRGWIYALGILWSFAISDQCSSQLIKKNVKRLRPCNELSLVDHRRTLVQCGTGYSFTSSHAANHTCIAVFILLTGAGFIGDWRFLFLPWALIISYAQVYVGVHYPGDVLAGMILGCMIGIMMSLIYNNFFNKKSIPSS